MGCQHAQQGRRAGMRARLASGSAMRPCSASLPWMTSWREVRTVRHNRAKTGRAAYGCAKGSWPLVNVHGPRSGFCSRSCSLRQCLLGLVRLSSKTWSQAGSINAPATRHRPIRHRGYAICCSECRDRKETARACQKCYPQGTHMQTCRHSFSWSCVSALNVHCTAADKNV